MDSRDDQSDNGFQFSRILSRESSVGQSSRIYYYRRAEGVPFQWEKQPGTPKNPPNEDVVPPLSPPPSIQSLGLPKPCFINTDDDEPQESKSLKVWLSKKINKKLHQLKTFGKSYQNSELMHGSDAVGPCDSDREFVASSFKNSTSSSSSSSSTDSYTSNRQQREQSSARRKEGCSPWDVKAMDKEDVNVSYRKMHKRAFSQEDDDKSFFLNSILSRTSTVDQSSHSYYRSTEGIAFKWEMQPGTPIHHPPQNEVIPPPSPPPMVQSLALPKPNSILHDQEEANNKSSSWQKIWLGIMNSKRMIKSSDEKIKEKGFRDSNELSFRLETSDIHGRRGDSVLLSSSSSSSSSSISKNKVQPFTKFRRDLLGGNFCLNPWKIKANLASSSRRI